MRSVRKMKFYHVRAHYLGSRAIIQALGYRDALKIQRRMGGKIV